MKFTMFFFSGTGNTWYVGNLISNKLEENGHEVKKFSLESPELKNQSNIQKYISESDTIILGYPIYGSDAPKIMLNFVKNLPEIPNGQNLNEKSSPQNHFKPILIFCTEMIASGNGAYFMHKDLQKKGYLINWAVHFQMPNNYSIPQDPLKWGATEEQLEKKLSKADKRTIKLINRLLSGKKWIQGKNIFSIFMGWFQRVLYRLEFKEMASKWSIDFDKCTKCMRCVKICPAENIKMDSDLISYSDKCILCQRCYNYCPTHAVLYSGKGYKEKMRLPYQGPTKDFKPEIFRPSI